MKYSTTLTLALATMATANWSLYCGDSVSTSMDPFLSYCTFTNNLNPKLQCTDGTLVASGSHAVESCASLGDTYDYCYIKANSIYYVDWWKAIFYEGADCVVTSVSGGLESKGLFDGSCTAAGSWKSYEVVVNA